MSAMEPRGQMGLLAAEVGLDSTRMATGGFLIRMDLTDRQERDLVVAARAHSEELGAIV